MRESKEQQTITSTDRLIMAISSITNPSQIPLSRLPEAGKSGADLFKLELEKALAATGAPAETLDFTSQLTRQRLITMMDEQILDSMDENPETIQPMDMSFPRLELADLNGAVQPPPEVSKIQHRTGGNDSRVSKQNFDPYIEKASETYGVDADLIRGVIRAESGFRPESTSPKGAMGLMQLMPGTARELGVSNAYDPEQNIMGGTKYLKGLLKRYDGDTSLALAAYNWGAGNVERNPHRMPEETRNYISRVTGYYRENKA